MNPFIGWHYISQILMTVYYLSKLITNRLRLLATPKFWSFTKIIILVTLHEQFYGISTHKMKRVTTLMKKGGTNHLVKLLINYL